MNNLVLSWKELAKEKYGSIAEGIRRMNKVCIARLTPSCVNTMIEGKKNVPASVNRFMTFEVVPFEYKKLKRREIDIGEFMERITIPVRIL